MHVSHIAVTSFIVSAIVFTLGIALVGHNLFPDFVTGGVVVVDGNGARVNKGGA